MDKNLTIYNKTEVVGYYKAQSELFDCEAHLVDRHFRNRPRILDIGVGGGRTTTALSAIASRYTGVDYSLAMVEACRERFPHLEFMQADASNMGEFADASYDAAMFSFNGIDTLTSDELRHSCLQEICRVLAPGGIFIFSSHNAGALACRPVFKDAAMHQAIWRVVRALFVSFPLAKRHISSGAFAKGEGYLIDPTHGGLEMYVSTPQTMIPQLEHAGFEVLESVGGHYPARAPDFMQPWFYYAARKKAT